MSPQLLFLQRTIQLSFFHLLIPFFLIGAVIGWRRGWREEAITAVGLLLALLLFSNNQVSSIIATLINRIVNAVGIFINVLFGSSNTPSEPAITNDNFQTFRTISFFLAVVLSYIIGSALGQRRGLGNGGKFLGIMVGVLNAYIVLSKVLDFLNARRAAGSDLPFDTSAQIIVPPIPQTNELRSNLPTIFALLFLIVLVVTFIRLPRTRQ